MADRLSEVNEEQAVKLLSEVAYGQHINGTKSVAMVGGVTLFITRLEEVKDFLWMGSIESLTKIGSKGVIGYVDLLKLQNWISDVFCDKELADAIGEEIEKGTCYADRLGPINQLIEERILQCKTLLQGRGLLEIK